MGSEGSSGRYCARDAVKSRWFFRQVSQKMLLFRELGGDPDGGGWTKRGAGGSRSVATGGSVISPFWGSGQRFLVRKWEMERKAHLVHVVGSIAL